MLLIRPQAIGAASLTSSNLYEDFVSGSFYNPSTSYSVDQFVYYSLPKLIAKKRIEITPKGRGIYLLKNSLGGGVAFDAKAYSQEMMDSDFTIRIQPKQTNAALTVGIGITPAGANDYSTTLCGVALWDAPFDIYAVVGGVVDYTALSTYTSSDYVFLSRAGSVVTILKGATSDVAAATLIYTFAANVSGHVALDCSFRGLGSADVQVEHYGYLSTLRQDFFTNTVAAVGANPPTSPGNWSVAGEAYYKWYSFLTYITGDRVTDPTSHRTYESVRGTLSVVTTSIATPCVVTLANHGLAAGTLLRFRTTDALPTGFAAGFGYYVVSPTANSFNIALSPGGAAIATSGTQSGTHSIIANPNENTNPADGLNPASWLDIGPSNRFAMFDGSVATYATHPTKIDFTVQITGRVDSLALLNLANLASIQIIVTDAVAGIVYNKTALLASSSGVFDWYSYFNEEVVQTASFLATDLPAYTSPTVRIIMSGSGSTPIQCGVAVIGLAKDLGRTLHDGAQIGIIDYSRKTADAFGNYSIVQRAYSKRGSFRMRLPKGAVDGVNNVLADYRATPAVYSASADYGATLIYGFFRDFQIEIDYPLESLVSIEIEGLT